MVGWPCRQAASEPLCNSISVRKKCGITERRKEVKSRFEKEEM
jgi:hypothetical protein